MPTLFISQSAARREAERIAQHVRGVVSIRVTPASLRLANGHREQGFVAALVTTQGLQHVVL